MFVVFWCEVCVVFCVLFLVCSICVVVVCGMYSVLCYVCNVFV